MLAHVPSFGRNPRGSPDFLAYPVPKTGMKLNSSDHPFKTFMDPFHWSDPTEERAQVSFIRQQCDEEVWNEVAKNMRPRPTIRKLVDIMSVIKCGNQVDGDKISARRDAVFEDYQDDVLSGKLWNNPPIRCENGEAKIDIIEGSKVHKQRPFYLHGTKADALRKIIERTLYEFGWLEGCMSSEWCSAPFTVPKPPPADQSSIDAWRLVVDYRALNAATVPDAHPLPLIEKEIAATEKDYNWLETIYCVLRRYHRTKNYTGLSPNELVFGREKMGPGPVMYHPRQCYDASQWFERIKDLESKWIQAKVENQADWLNFKNKSRTQGKPFEKGQQVWLRKSDETLKDNNKLLPLWDGPFQVSGQLSETTFNIQIEPGRHQEVHRDRLKAEVPCPKGRFKPLYWTSKYLSDRKMVTSSFELEKILDYKKNARNKWYFLCRWKGFGPEEDKWEPASSFIHGYTDTFIKFLKKHPEIDKELSLIKDCVTKEDLQAQEEAPIVAESIRDKI